MRFVVNSSAVQNQENIVHLKTQSVTALAVSAGAVSSPTFIDSNLLTG